MALTWTPVTGAAQYRVERAAAGTAAWSVLATTTDGSHVDPTATRGTSYVFAVTALDAGGRSSARSSEVGVDVPPLVALAALDPAQGSTDGGTSVTLTGSRLDLVTAVLVDGTPATDIEPVSSGSLTFTTPPHAATTAAVTVMTADPVTATATALTYTYVDAPTSVTGLSPTSGRAAGGDEVTITGTGLRRVDEVRFGDQVATILERTGRRIIVATPVRVPGEVAVKLLTGDGVTVVADAPFTFAQEALAPVDTVTPAAGTVLLDPDEVRSVETLPAGTLELVLDPDDRFAVGTGVFLRPGHEDAWSGLAAVVRSVETDDTSTVLGVEQVPVDQVLADQRFAASSSFTEPATASRLAFSAPIAAASGTPTSAFDQNIMNVNRHWLDCRRVVQHEGNYETLEPVVDDQVDVKVQFTIADLQADVIDHGTGSGRYYEASVSGKPTLKIVARADFEATCSFLPALTQKLARELRTPEFVVKLKPDLSVTFSVDGKAVITKETSFVLGLRKIGDGDTTVLKDFRQSPATIEGSAGLGIRIRAGVDISVLYKGFVGLAAKIGPVADLSYRYDAVSLNHCVTLGFEFEVELNARLDLIVLEWSQPLLDLSFPIVDEEVCTSDEADPDTTMVLDPNLGDDPTASYVWTPDSSSTSPFPLGAFEPINYGDAYYLRKDITLEAGTNYRFTRTLIVPEGVTLTVEAGAHIKLGHCYWTIWLPAGNCLRVDGGTVLMNGTAADPIVITQLSDDTLDGDTDGIQPEHSMSGIAPVAVTSGLLTMRGVEMRYAGLALSGGTVSVESSTFRSSSIRGRADNLRVDRVHFPEGAGSLEVYVDGRGTLSKSRFDASTVGLSGTTWAVTDNQLGAGSSMTLTSVEAEARRNRFLAPAATIRVDPNTAAGTFTENRTGAGRPVPLDVLAGTIHASRAWSAPVTYLLNGTVQVPEDVTLTLHPGTVVKGLTTASWSYTTPAAFQVDGILRTLGSPSDPVVLTSRNDSLAGGDTAIDPTQWTNGDTWGGLRVGEHGHLDLTHTRLSDYSQPLAPGPTASADLSHLTINGTVPWSGAITTSSESFSLVDSDLDLAGATVILAGGDPLVSDTIVRGGQLRVQTPRAVLAAVRLDHDQRLGGVAATPDGAGATIDVTGASGGPVAISVEGGPLTGEVTWPGGRTYLLTGDVTIRPEAALTLGAGSVVKGLTTPGYWGSRVGLRVEGRLHAAGAAAAPVVLTTRDDSTAGLDLAAPETFGGSEWGGVTVVTGGELDLEHVRAAGARTVVTLQPGTSARISHLQAGGLGSWDPLVSSDSEDLVVADSTLDAVYDGYPAVALRGPSSLLRSTIQHGYVAVSSPAALIRHNRFLGLSGTLLRNDSGETLDARENWWGSADGPPTGTSASVVGPVDVAPWCTTSTC